MPKSGGTYLNIPERPTRSLIFFFLEAKNLMCNFKSILKHFLFLIKTRIALTKNLNPLLLFFFKAKCKQNKLKREVWDFSIYKAVGNVNRKIVEDAHFSTICLFYKDDQKKMLEEELKRHSTKKGKQSRSDHSYRANVPTQRNTPVRQSQRLISKSSNSSSLSGTLPVLESRDIPG